MRNMFPGRTFVVLFVFLVSMCDGGLLEPITHVKIINGLGNGKDLSVHCKSKNDDLGIHVIPPLSFYEFSFRPDYFWRTLFFGRFWWGGEPAHWFDIYIQRRDENRCGKHCTWLVIPQGPCLFDDRVKKFTLCEKWNDQKKLEIGTASHHPEKLYDDHSRAVEVNDKRGKCYQKLYGHVN